MALEDLGSLLIRLTVALLFLEGAWASGKDAVGRQGVIADTGLVFTWRPHLFALTGIVLAGAGGLSMLLGIFPRLGALAMAVFLVPAALIHLAKRRQALALMHTILHGLPDKRRTRPRLKIRLTVAATFGHGRQSTPTASS